MSTYGIRFSKPGAEFRINLGRRFQPEVVDVIPGRNGVDAPEARVWQPAGQDDMAVEPALSRCDLCKRHPHLKGNARFLWKDSDRPTGADRAADRIKERPDRPILAAKVMSKVVAAAGMRLIAVGEAALASRTLPEWRAVHRSILPPMFTFARRLAWFAAFALPIAETWRRWGALWVQPAAYLDDVVMGVLFLLGAVMSTRGERGRRWLAATYGSAVCLNLVSLMGSVESSAEIDPSGLPGTTVVGIKSWMMALAIAGLVGAVVGKSETPPQ